MIQYSDWPHRLSARTRDFHSRKQGSTPCGVTNMEISGQSENGLPALLAGAKPLDVVADAKKTPRAEAFFEAVNPGISDLVKKGAEFYQFSVEDFYAKRRAFLATKPKANPNVDCVEVCQNGADRSKKDKLLGIDAGIPPLLSLEDEDLLRYRSATNLYPRIGMSFDTLADRFVQGIVKDGEIHPSGFKEGTVVRNVVGFVNSDRDLSDVDLFCNRLNIFLARKGQEHIKLNVVLVFGTSDQVGKLVDNQRNELGIKPVISRKVDTSSSKW